MKMILILELRVVFLFAGGLGAHARRQAHTPNAVVGTYMVPI